MKTLYLITARGGSKGLPRKNIKLLAGKPLIYYSIDIARQMASNDDICVSTNDHEIIQFVENYGLKVPFVRPENLATDKVSHHKVILHAINFFQEKGLYYDNILLLQPTTPFRRKTHIEKMKSLYNNDLDMVVSVKISKANPYFNLYEEQENGFLTRSKASSFSRRQDPPIIYQINGSLYLINVKSVLEKSLHQFDRIKKFLLDDIYSMDIDNELDFAFCEFLIQNNQILNNIKNDTLI